MSLCRASPLSADKKQRVASKPHRNHELPLPKVFLHELAQALLPLNCFFDLTQEELTLFVFLMEPLQKLHLPDADQPMVPLLHWQHFSVVPKGDQRAPASIKAIASSSPSTDSSALS